MARKALTFSIDGREESVELYELRTKDIIELLQDDNLGSSIKDFKNLINKFLPKCSNLKVEDFYNMYPSEMEIVWEKFKEVNSVFLRVSQQMGLNQMLGDFKEVVVKAITEDFSGSLADLLKKDMSELLTMDTPSS